MTSVEERFCVLLRDRKFEEAAELVEEYARSLVERGVASSLIQRLSKLIERLKESRSRVDRVLFRSEMLGQRMGRLSETLAELCLKIGEEGYINLSKLMEALNNFYRYYAGMEE